MGMYTEFYFRTTLRKEGNLETIQILAEIFADPNSLPKHLPDHPFFQSARWDALFFGSSAYFPEVLQSEFKIQSYIPSDNFYEIGIRSSFKNYGQEIALFLDWINPAISEPKGTFVGYSLYEESLSPTLHYVK